MLPYYWREKRRVGLGRFEPANEETSTMCQGSFGFSVTDSDSVAERFELSVGVVFGLVLSVFVDLPIGFFLIF